MIKEYWKQFASIIAWNHIGIVDYKLIDKTLYLQESNGIWDWACNLMALPIFSYGKWMHVGFSRQYARIRDVVLNNEIDTIVGYSLGGALAQIAAYDIYKQKKKQVRIFVYGSPRPFVFGCKKLLNIHSVKLGRDIVTSVPFWHIPAKARIYRIGPKGNIFKDHGRYGEVLQ